MRHFLGSAVAVIAMGVSGCSGIEKSKTLATGKRTELAKGTANQQERVLATDIKLVPVSSWLDERAVRGAIESFESDPDIVVQLYFKPINKEEGIWEHYPSSEHEGDVDVKFHSNVSFFSAHLEADIINALDKAKVTESSIFENSRQVKFLISDFGEREYILPQGENGILKLSFRLLNYGDVVEGSVFYRKNARYNSIEYLRKLEPSDLPGRYFLEKKKYGSFRAVALFSPDGPIIGIQKPQLIDLKSKGEE